MQRNTGELSSYHSSHEPSSKGPTPNSFVPRHRQEQEVAIDADVSSEVVDFGDNGGKETELIPVLPSLTEQASAAPKQRQKFRPVKPKSQFDKMEKQSKVIQQDKKKEANGSTSAGDPIGHAQGMKSKHCNSPENSPALSSSRVGNSESQTANHRKRKPGNQRRRDSERKRQAFVTNECQPYNVFHGTETWNCYENMWYEYYRETFDGRSTQHHSRWDRQGAGYTMHEREWHVRRQELDALAHAQAKRQQELDALAVSLETREREQKNNENRLVAENHKLTQSILSKKKELEILCEEHRNKLLFFEKEHDSEKQRWRKELDVLRWQQSKEKAEHKRALDELQRESEGRLNAVQNKINELTDKETRISLEIQKQKENINKARKTLECEFEQRRRELDSLELALSSRQKVLDEKEVAQSLREDHWLSMKSQVEASFTTRENQMAARESMLYQKQVDLDQFKAAAEASERERAMQYENWAAEKDKLQKSLRDLEIMLTKKKNELEMQAIQQAKQQKDFHSRDAALKRRARELRAQKRDIDLAQAKQSSEKRSTEELKSYSTTKEFPFSREQSADKGSSVKPAPERKRGESTDSKDAAKNKQAGIDYILIDSDSDDEVQQKKPKPAASSCNRTWDYGKYYNAQFTVESAQELQERLFREAAEKLRARASSSASADSSKQDNAPFITTPISNINELYPEHWRWKDAYSVLGLPAQSSMKLVKTHYRKLARIYHPDSSGSSSTSNKFHAITLAYRKLHG
jgi:hypothetical protein